MFRPMRRIKQQLSEEEALDVLKNAKRGVLSVIGDDGWPYGIYLNPLYDESTGRFYFHGAKAGHKIDALKKDARASFTVIDDGVKDEGGWAYTFRSVVVFGRVEFVEDQNEVVDICRRHGTIIICDEIWSDIIMDGYKHVQVFALTPAHITGKRVHEA